MSLTSENYKEEFAATGGTVYNVTDFRIWESEDEEVVHVTTAGVETTLTPTTSYAISNIASTGFTVTTVDTYSSGTIVVRRNQPKTQDADWERNGALSTPVLEKQLDKIVAMIQSNAEELSRSLLQAATADSAIVFPVASANALIGWNSGGTGLENANNPAVEAAISAAAALASENAAEAAENTAVASAALFPTITTSNASQSLKVNNAGDAFEAVPENLFNVKAYGAIGDGTTDDSASIIATIAAAGGGDEIVFPAGTYLISESIVISKGITLRGLGRVQIIGDFAGIFFDFDGSLSATELVGWQSGTTATRTPFSLYDIDFQMATASFATESGSTAIRIRNSYYGTFRPGKIQGFGKGIELAGTGSKSSFYNTIYLRLIWNCKYGIYVNTTTGNYVRANKVIGGHIQWTTGFWDTESPYGIYLKGVATGNPASFSFLGVGIESPATSNYQFMYLERTGSNLFEMGHLEGGATNNPKITFGDTNVIDNIFILPYSLLKETEISGTSYAQNRWISKSLNVENSHPTSTNEWNKTVAMSGYLKRILRYLDYSNNDTIFGLDATSHATANVAIMLAGRKISFGSSAPSAGGWGQGSVIFNTGAAAGGSPGWVCTESGTFGSAYETDGVSDGSTAVITMSDASDFEVYDWVDVDKGFPTTGPYRVIYKTATSITLDTDSDSSETGVTVNTSDPTFKELANIGA